LPFEGNDENRFHHRGGGGLKAIFDSADRGKPVADRRLGLTESGEVVGLIVHPDDRRAITPTTDITLDDGVRPVRLTSRRSTRGSRRQR
jgi:hypothetical protein